MPITPLPTPGPNYLDPVTFPARAQALALALPTMVGEINAALVGLGTGAAGLLPPIGNIGVTDNSIIPGLYGFNTAAGSSGGPPGVQRGSLLHTRRGNTGGETQLLVVEYVGGAEGPVGGIYSRARIADTWYPWREQIAQGVAPVRFGELVVIADDAVGTIIPPRPYGYLLVSSGSPTHAGLIYFKADASPAAAKHAGGAAMQDPITGTLGNFSATDGNTLISARDGSIQINNRSGLSRTYIWSAL